MDIMIRFLNSVPIPDDIRRPVYEYAHLNMNLYLRIYPHDVMVIKNRHVTTDSAFKLFKYTILDYNLVDNVVGELFSSTVSIERNYYSDALINTSCEMNYSNVTDKEVEDHMASAILCGRYPSDQSVYK